MTNANQTYAQGKLDAIALAADLGGDVTMPARQFQGMLEILGMADGSTELTREIAAKILDVPVDLEFLQVIRTRVGGLWRSGERVEWNGPLFDFVNGSH